MVASVEHTLYKLGVAPLRVYPISTGRSRPMSSHPVYDRLSRDVFLTISDLKTAWRRYFEPLAKDACGGSRMHCNDNSNQRILYRSATIRLSDPRSFLLFDRHIGTK